MTANYFRSEILSFYDLTEKQQRYILDFQEPDEAIEDSFVEIQEGEDMTPLPLSMFIRTGNNKFTHGIYSLSAFSGYFVTLSKCNSMATVAYKHF